MIDIAFEVVDKQAGENLRDLLCEGLQGLPAFKDNTIVVTNPEKTDAGRWTVFLNIGWVHPDEDSGFVVASCTSKVTNFDVKDYEAARDRAIGSFEEIL